MAFEKLYRNTLIAEVWRLKVRQEIGVTFDSHQIWTVEWSYQAITGCVQFFLSYPPSGEFCQLRKSSMQANLMAAIAEIFSSLKIGAKSFGDGSQDICKDTEINLGPFASFQEASFISFLCQSPHSE